MSFPLVGNERLKDILEAAISARRLPHAILLEGEAGLGKRTLGRWIARSALCGSGERPCGKCRSCELFAAGTHPDFVEIMPEKGKKSVTVDRIRELRRQAFIKPHISERRVFFISDCGSMNEQAQNALLKILEEPPQGVIFILAAPSKTVLLDTVISRCVILTLSPPERAEAAQVIKKITAENGTAAEGSAINDALEASGGNIGAALAILSGAADEAAKAAKKFVSLLPNGSRTEMLKALQPFCKDRVAADRLIAALQTETAAALRVNYKRTTVAHSLNGFYNRLGEYAELLKTNINLPLLFTAMVSRIER